VAHKYHAEPEYLDGHRFASRKEALRYIQLRALQRGGHLSGLELQPSYDLHVGSIRVARYVADFRYREGERVVVEDVKGVRTPLYRLKKKMVEAEYGFRIRET
jgi:hypothetical protein